MNRKQSSAEVARLATATLTDKSSSQTAKSLAASVVAQTNTRKQTGAQMEDLASRVLQSPKYSDETKTLAASVLPHSNKARSGTVEGRPSPARREHGGNNAR